MIKQQQQQQQPQQRLGIKQYYFKAIRALYNKPIANTICISEKIKYFPLRLGSGLGCSVSALLNKISLEILAIAFRWEKIH